MKVSGYWDVTSSPRKMKAEREGTPGLKTNIHFAAAGQSFPLIEKAWTAQKGQKANLKCMLPCRPLELARGQATGGQAREQAFRPGAKPRASLPRWLRKQA